MNTDPYAAGYLAGINDAIKCLPEAKAPTLSVKEKLVGAVQNGWYRYHLAALKALKELLKRPTPDEASL